MILVNLIPVGLCFVVLGVMIQNVSNIYGSSGTNEGGLGDRLMVTLILEFYIFDRVLDPLLRQPSIELWPWNEASRLRSLQ